MEYSRIIKGFEATVLLALSLLAAISCGETKKEEPLLPPKIVIKTTTVPGEAGSQFMSVTASGSWTLTTSASWLTTEPSTGTGSSDMVVLHYEENTEAVRSATVTISSSGGTASASLAQNKLVTPTPIDDGRGYGAETATQNWLELPETKKDDGQEFFSHDMTIGSAKMRNYSFYWDYDNLVASWVAYPLCAGNIGSGSRTDEWGLDPLLPEAKQPVLFKAYSGGGWSRGHQIPSADRLPRSANVQTFYFTNMTPQDYNFNGGTWANLETQVRTWARKTGATAGTDTLYVVTGCITGSSPKKAYDNTGKAVSVPQGYFKALLRYKNSTSIGHEGFMGCAFYFDNEDKYASKVSKEMSMSIASLEKKLGYKLFVNLDAKVGSETAKTIKEEEPATVSWWWQ